MSARTGQGPAPAPAASNASIGDLLGNVSRDFSTLVRQELDLAKAELRQDVRNAGKAGGMFGGAAIAGFMVLLFASCAVWWGLAAVMPAGWAALIVAAVWAVLAAVLATIARRRMKEARGLPRTASTARQIPDALRGR